MFRFLLSVAGIYVCFLTWGLLQERVSTTPYGSNKEKFKYFLFLNLCQSVISAAVAYVFLVLVHERPKMPTSDLRNKYMQVALTNCLASPFGYASLRHIDYPTLLLGKSCKLVPVVAMNFILYGKRFPVYKYLSVFLITLGVSYFMLLQPAKPGKGQATSSLWGILLLSINLLMDGATNSTQDRIFHKHRVRGQHMMLFMNIFTSIYTIGFFILPEAISANEFGHAINFCTRHPNAMLDILIFSLSGGLGQCFIFHTLEKYGSLALVTVTVTRKMFSMILSVMWFGHQMLLGQWAGVAIVFAGIALDSGMKTIERRSKVNVVKIDVNNDANDAVHAKSE